MGPPGVQDHAHGDAAGPRLVHDEDLTEAKRRRHRLVALLVGGRMLAATVGVVLWWFNPGPLLKDPMNSLVHLVAPHTGMGDRLARLIAAAILKGLGCCVDGPFGGPHAGLCWRCINGLRR